MEQKHPREHREGRMIELVDTIQELIHLQYQKNLIIQDGECLDDYKYNPEVIEKIIDKLKVLRLFDITIIGNLYLTSGGRVVIDQGYGEYFNESDKVIFTLEELKIGIKYADFVKRIKELEQR